MNRFHEERRQRLTLLLDNEEWRAAEVPKELQEAVDDVLLQVKPSFQEHLFMYSIQGQGCESGKKSKPKRAELIASYVDVSGEKFSVIGTGSQFWYRICLSFHQTFMQSKIAEV